MTLPPCKTLALLAMAAGLLLGLSLGWWLWHARPAPAESAAPAEYLPRTDTHVLERDPAAVVPPKLIAATKEFSPKAKLTRAATLQVQPKQENCAPVDVEIGVVTQPDHTQRIIARSDNAEIIGGVDIPLTTQQVVKEMKWAAGVSYEPTEHSYGVFIDRDVGPFRFSAELRQSKVQGATAILRAGIRF